MVLTASNTTGPVGYAIFDKHMSHLHYIETRKDFRRLVAAQRGAFDWKGRIGSLRKFVRFGKRALNIRQGLSEVFRYPRQVVSRDDTVEILSETSGLFQIPRERRVISDPRVAGSSGNLAT